MSGLKVSRNKIRRNTRRKMNCWVIWRDEQSQWMADFEGDTRIELTAKTHEELIENIGFVTEAGQGAN